MKDLISRQAAIEKATKDHDFFRGATTPTDKARRDELLNVMCWLGELPSAQPEQTKMIKEIRKWINSKNRGSADYFIVDKIEEIINKYEE